MNTALHFIALPTHFLICIFFSDLCFSQTHLQSDFFPLIAQRLVAHRQRFDTLFQQQRVIFFFAAESSSPLSSSALVPLIFTLSRRRGKTRAHGEALGEHVAKRHLKFCQFNYCTAHRPHLVTGYMQLRNSNF